MMLLETKGKLEPQSPELQGACGEVDQLVSGLVSAIDGLRDHVSNLRDSELRREVYAMDRQAQERFVHVVGLSHHSAPVEVREKLAVAQADWNAYAQAPCKHPICDELHRPDLAAWLKRLIPAGTPRRCGAKHLRSNVHIFCSVGTMMLRMILAVLAMVRVVEAMPTFHINLDVPPEERFHEEQLAVLAQMKQVLKEKFAEDEVQQWVAALKAHVPEEEEFKQEIAGIAKDLAKGHDAEELYDQILLFNAVRVTRFYQSPSPASAASAAAASASASASSPAPDRSGHCRTSSASSRSQWALPDLICQLQISVGTAGPEPPDRKNARKDARKNARKNAR
eukprot:s184_g9.t1